MKCFSPVFFQVASHEYARASAEELGIAHCFQAFLPKPQAYIDDQAVADWRFCRHILPANSSEIE